MVPRKGEIVDVLYQLEPNSRSWAHTGAFGEIRRTTWLFSVERMIYMLAGRVPSCLYEINWRK